MIDFYGNDFWDEYLERIGKSAYWKISHGAVMSGTYGYDYINQLEDIAALPIEERETALKELIWKNRRG